MAWDVEVTNQDGELVASYDILTLVAKKGALSREAVADRPSWENPFGRVGARS